MEYTTFISEATETLSTSAAKYILEEISRHNLNEYNVFELIFEILDDKKNYRDIIHFLLYILLFSILIKTISNISPISVIAKNSFFSLFSLLLIYQIYNTVDQSYICIKELSLFFGVLSPLAGTLTACGGGIMTANVQGVTFSFFISICQLFLNCFLPFVTAVFISIAIIDTFSGENRMASVSIFIKTSLFTVFAVAVSLIFIIINFYNKSAVTNDTISSKSLKLIIGNAIPIVGGTVSDALRLVQNGIINTKNQIGIVSVIFIIALFLPAFAVLLIYSFILNFFGFLCDYFYISEFKGVIVHLKCVIDFTLASLSVITTLSFININLFMNVAGSYVI